MEGGSRSSWGRTAAAVLLLLALVACTIALISNGRSAVGEEIVLLTDAARKRLSEAVSAAGKVRGIGPAWQGHVGLLDPDESLLSLFVVYSGAHAWRARSARQDSRTRCAKADPTRTPECKAALNK
jgi:hypothetical protein